MKEPPKIFTTKETRIKIKDYASDLQVSSMHLTRKGFWDIADDYVIGQDSAGGAVLIKDTLRIYPIDGDEKWLVSYRRKK